MRTVFVKAQEQRVPRPLVLVTYNADATSRAILKVALGDVADLAFLADAAPINRGSMLERAEVLFTWAPGRDLRSEEFRRLTRTRLIQLLSIGVDHVAFSLLPTNAVVAKNTGAFAEAMAEHVAAMALAAAKQLLPKHAKLAVGEFDMTSPSRTLRGGTCTIVGYGSIGRAIGELMHNLGLRVLGVNRSGLGAGPAEEVGTLDDCERLIRQADVVAIALPLTVATKGLIGTRELAWMKDDAILVNVARADIVEEDALYDRLLRCPSFQVCIDVWWVEPYRHGTFSTKHPFFALPNVIGSPHNSSVVHGGIETATRLGADNVRRFLVSGEVAHVVPDEERHPLGLSVDRPRL